MDENGVLGRVFDEATNALRISVPAGGVSDGDKGHITVSASGATWTIDTSGMAAIVAALFPDTDHGNTGSAEDIVFGGIMSSHRLVLNSASVAITFSGATAGRACWAFVEAIQDATGSRVFTWPAAVKWTNGGPAPTLSVSANARDRLAFVTRDGGTTIDGMITHTALA